MDSNTAFMETLKEMSSRQLKILNRAFKRIESWEDAKRESQPVKLQLRKNGDPEYKGKK